jgi:NADPH:quinone reductase-like Zn-dependent oxidoreductase
MKAAWFESFGPARQVIRIGDQPVPAPGPGEVLVRLATSGINPSDVKKRAGSSPTLLDQGLVIPNSDGAGVVESVGEGVPKSRVGERVWIYQAQHGRRFGTAAEYVAIDARRAAQLPDQAGFEVGACLGIPVMTAHRCVFADGAVNGQTVLVTGGAGRVGYYAIQWAKSAGERVKAANGGEPVDRVVEVEFGGNLPEVLQCIRVGGTIATYSSMQAPEPKLPFYRMMFMDLTVRMVLVYVMPEPAKQAAIADIGRYLAEGRLQHRIAHRLPLAELARANELVEQGELRGCVVVDIGE